MDEVIKIESLRENISAKILFFRTKVLFYGLN